VTVLSFSPQAPTKDSTAHSDTAILDRLYVSEEDCFSAVRVLTSVAKSDHRAIVSVSVGRVSGRSKTRVRVVDLSDIYDATDAQAVWNLFFEECNRRLCHFYPIRCVSMSSADPPTTLQGSSNF